jgi:hypothetical protein
MRAVQLLVVLWAAAMPGLAGAADAPFPFDREQSIELATAYIRAEFQNHPQAALPGVDFEHPLVVGVRDGSQRRFVFVSFTSTLAKWGEYVIFELCGPSAHAVPNRAGKVIDIEFFREVVSKIDPTTRLALPNVCGAGEA